MLQMWLDDWRSEGIGYWCLERQPDGAVIGFAGIRPMSRADHRLFNLYYRLAASAWGHGLAKRFAREAVALAHRKWAERAVIARTRPSNLASERTALAAGLRHVGHDREGLLVLADRTLDQELLAVL